MCLSIRSDVTVQVRAPKYMQYDHLDGEAEVIVRLVSMFLLLILTRKDFD
jgi:hypothetical protein